MIDVSGSDGNEAVRRVHPSRRRVQLGLIALLGGALVGWQSPRTVVLLVNGSAHVVVAEVTFGREKAVKQYKVAPGTSRVLYEDNYRGGSCSRQEQLRADISVTLRQNRRVLALSNETFRRAARWEESRRWILTVDDDGVGAGSDRVRFSKGR